jgi:selenocysteine-specific elongation factor
MKHIIVGTAGHIDHGKSALVLALTGTDPDRLEEEKRRGITIDLGFAHLDLGEGVRVGFIDVPGHERFVKNMLAGATGIDLVMLVVAADESIKPQTREHFDICRLLGVRHGLVVITKSDLIDHDLLETVRLEVQEFVAGSFLEGAPVIAVSARSGEGLETLKAELLRLGGAISPKPAGLPFRLPIDRAFVMKGFGAVVTGTLISGRIEKDSEVEVFPLGRRVRVRGIEVHNQPADAALAGQRTALNLTGIEARELARGMVLAPPGLFRVTSRLDVALSLLESARPLKNRARVHFHCGTAETIAEVVLLDGKELKPAEPRSAGYAQLRLAEPGLFLPGDRFIIRQFSPVTTIGGGSILDSQPLKHPAKPDPSVRAFLGIMEGADPESRLEALVRQSGEVTLAHLVARTGWLPAEVVRTAMLVENRGLLVPLRGTGQPPSLFMHAEYFRALEESAVKTLEEFHRANPLLPGLSKEELRARVESAISARPAAGGAGRPEASGYQLHGRDTGARRGRKAEGLRPPAAAGLKAGATRSAPATSGARPSVAAFNAVLQALSAQGKVDTRGETVMQAGRVLRLTPEEAEAREQISRAFEKAGLAVPSAAEVLATLRIDLGRAEKILQILLKEKVLVKVAEGLIFYRGALEGLRGTLRQRKAQNDRISVAAFKEMTGLSRKYVIPLLEYLDRERVTRRQGDERIIL